VRSPVPRSRVPADRLQLQRVLLNLVMNELEAIAAIAIRPPELDVESRIGGSNPQRYAAGLALKQIAFQSVSQQRQIAWEWVFRFTEP
jgi:hypothetical protein